MAEKKDPKQTTHEKGADEGPKKVKQRGSPNWPQDGVISLRVDHNPKRTGTKAEIKFARYKHGMTVAQFIDSGGTYTSLKWDTEHGYIAVNETPEQRAEYNKGQAAKTAEKAAKEADKAAKRKAAADAKAAKKAATEAAKAEKEAGAAA